MRFNRLLSGVIFVLTACAVHEAGAQITGVITGQVLDSGGAVLPGAEVTIRHQNTGQLRREFTDERGRYRVTGLPIGFYEIKAALHGFQPVMRQAVPLSMGRTLSIDLMLAVEGIKQTVLVTAAPLIVESMTSQVGGLVYEQQIEDLPLNGRDFTQLIAFQAGANTPPVVNGSTKISISGGRPYQTSYLLDGTDISRWDGKPGGVTGLMLGVETIGEFAVLSNLFSPEYGGTGVSLVSSVTKSGTNVYHGSAYYYMRNSALDAKNFFDAPGEPIPGFRRHQFGGSLGGPVVRNRLFFFGN
jgi:hypothetical protein